MYNGSKVTLFHYCIVRPAAGENSVTLFLSFYIHFIIVYYVSLTRLANVEPGNIASNNQRRIDEDNFFVDTF